MKKVIPVALLITASVLQFCTGTKKASSAAPIAAVPAKLTYARDISPLISLHCAPCHIANAGNKEPYDNYTNTKSDIDDIIARINKNPGERGFMPVRHPKLSDSTIQVFASWKNDGLLEK